MADTLQVSEPFANKEALPIAQEIEADLFAPVIRSSRLRAIWLGLNLLTALLASWFIGLFQATLEEVVFLAVLMPVVASMGVIAGSQT